MTSNVTTTKTAISFSKNISSIKYLVVYFWQFFFSLCWFQVLHLQRWQGWNLVHSIFKKLSNQNTRGTEGCQIRGLHFGATSVLKQHSQLTSETLSSKMCCLTYNRNEQKDDQKSNISSYLTWGWQWAEECKGRSSTLLVRFVNKSN